MRRLPLILPLLLGAALSKETNPCHRPCVAGGKPMNCVYTFKFQWYETLTRACYNCLTNSTACDNFECVPGNGIQRAVALANRQLPGPSIEICAGDTIDVLVENELYTGETTTVHFHGLHMKDAPFLDGVPMVTQCPIQPGGKFRYQFTPTQVGTFYWHSHTGMQRGDGLAGSLIVRQPKAEDPHDSLYDVDVHTILVQDWTAKATLEQFINHHYSGGSNDPDYILINGRGTNGGTPSAKFSVKAGQRHRFRLISNGMLQCPLAFHIQDHELILVSLDSFDIKATIVDTVMIYGGERIDFILKPKVSSPEGSYTMWVKGLIDCKAPQAYQRAALVYDDAMSSLTPFSYDDLEISLKDQVVFSPLNEGYTVKRPTISQIHGFTPAPKRISDTPDVRYLITMDFKYVNNPEFHNEVYFPIHNFTFWKRLYSPQLNNISRVASYVPFLTQFDQLNHSSFCDSSTLDTVACGEKYCACQHRLKVKTGDLVELFFTDVGQVYDAMHPMHIHGYAFYVVGMDRVSRNLTKAEVNALFEDESLRTNLTTAPLKDTIPVFDGGYIIVRFVADNPGTWLLHCHLGWHDAIGMSLVLQVGEPQEWVKPPSSFPRCGDYTGVHTPEPAEESGSGTSPLATYGTVACIVVRWLTAS